MRYHKLALFALGPVLFCVSAGAQVRVSESSIDLPTYAEAAPEPIMLYPVHRPGAGPPERTHWRTVEIENEYLKCTILPDLGGRIYSCIDKIGKQDLFYANPVIKKYIRNGELAVAAGDDFGSTDPVDIAMRQNPDGSASVFVGRTTDREGLRWTVEIRLEPSVDLIEERVTLSNPTATRRAYGWWNRAAVPGENARFDLPCYLVETAKGKVEPWTPASQTADGIERFAHRCDEPFVAASSRPGATGTAHYASVAELPLKGVEAPPLSSLKTFTDDGSQHVTIEAGSPTSFLEPRQIRQFVEYWMPFRSLGGLSRVNPNAAVFIGRTEGSVHLGINVYRALSRASARLLAGDRVLLQETADLTPAKPFTRTIADKEGTGTLHLELQDAQGEVLMTHDDGVYEALKGEPPDLSVAPKQTEPRDETVLAAGTQLELAGQLLKAEQVYAGGLKTFPKSDALMVATARVLVALHRYEDAVRVLNGAAPTPEVRLYRGIAYSFLMGDAKARTELEAVAPSDVLAGGPARLELAQLRARDGDGAGALHEVQEALQSRPDLAEAGWLEVALLRTLHRDEEARQRLAHWMAVDPADPLLRHERVKLGTPGEELPAQALEAASQYMRIGLWGDAVELLGHGADDPLSLYYRGYCKAKQGGSGQEDFAAAAKLPANGVVPWLPDASVVLKAALKQNTADANAHFLLGRWYVASGAMSQGAREWQDAVKNHGAFPVIQANLPDVLAESRRKPEVPETAAGPAPSTASVGPAATPAVNMTPEARAMQALNFLAAGRTGSAAELFTEQNFPKERQSEIVRWTFIETRLQAILDLARGRHCNEAIAGAEGVGDETKGLTFTMYGFANILKSARVQYLLGTAEALCSDEKAARRAFTKAAKSGERSGSAIEVAYAVLAASKVSGSVSGVSQAVEQLGKLSEPNVEQWIARGVLQRAAGNVNEATESFQTAVREAGVDAVLRYQAQAGLAGR